MPIQTIRSLEALGEGTFLEGKYRGKVRTGEVLRLDDGSWVLRTDEGQFRSPSSAAKAITGSAVNGWVFWSRVSDADLIAEAAAHEAGLGADLNDLAATLKAQNAAKAAPAPKATKPTPMSSHKKKAARPSDAPAGTKRTAKPVTPELRTALDKLGADIAGVLNADLAGLDGEPVREELEASA